MLKWSRCSSTLEKTHSLRHLCLRPKLTFGSLLTGSHAATWGLVVILGRKKCMKMNLLYSHKINGSEQLSSLAGTSPMYKLCIGLTFTFLS